MGSRPILLDIGRAWAVLGQVRRTSQIQARRVQYPMILDGYLFNEKFTPMFLNGLFIKPSNCIQPSVYWTVCHIWKYYYECTIISVMNLSLSPNHCSFAFLLSLGLYCCSCLSHTAAVIIDIIYAVILSALTSPCFAVNAKEGENTCLL